MLEKLTMLKNVCGKVLYFGKKIAEVGKLKKKIVRGNFLIPPPRPSRKIMVHPLLAEWLPDHYWLFCLFHSKECTFQKLTRGLWKHKYPLFSLLVYRMTMPSAKRLSSRFHSCPWSFTSWPTIHFLDHLFSLGHYPLIYQLPEGLYFNNHERHWHCEKVNGGISVN